MDDRLREQIELSYRTADEFTKLYYESVDKKRHLMEKFYMNDGLLVWNGNGSQGKEAIQKFFQELPASSHQLTTLDIQPIMADDPSTKIFIIQTSGMVKFDEKPQKPFQQTITITNQSDKWKIVSDCFRLQDALAQQEQAK